MAILTEPRDTDDFHAGVDFAIEALAVALGIDVNSFSHDAATETFDGDVLAVIGNALTAALGEDWIDELHARQGAQLLAGIGVQQTS